MPLPPDPEIEPLELAKDEELVVFRVVRSADPTAADYVESFRSHSALGIPPRGKAKTHPLIYEGISVFDRAEAAVETAQRFPRIGSHVAELRIRVETGVRYLKWGPRGHLTLWGDSLKIAESTVDIIPIDPQGVP